MADVDDIWQQMQQSAAPRQFDVDRVLRKSVASSSSNSNSAACTSQQRTSKTKRTSERSRHGSAATVDASARSAATAVQRTEPLPTQLFNLQREMNRLADERGSVRKQAALALEARFLIAPTASDASDDRDERHAATVFSEIAKPLFKRFNDPVEKVRDVCIRIATRFVAHEQDLLRVLPYLMPAITNRINSQFAYDEQQQQFTRDAFLHDAFKRGRVFVDAHEHKERLRVQPSEPSEEIRLLFLELLGALLENAFARSASSILHAYMFDVLVLLISGVHDPFQDVNVRACALLQAISNHMVSVMKHFSVACVRACRHLLVHRLARVRIAAIETIRALVTCPNRDKCKGSGTEAIVDLLGHCDDNVIPIAAFYTHDVRVNYCAKLNQDANALVRQAFFAMICDWIAHLPDRYDHESRLMPYVLSAVSDEHAGIAAHALATLAVLGANYEREHGEEVLEMKQYGVDGKNPSYNYAKALPPPFGAARPALGTRLYVRGRARRFLQPILRELGNWQRETQRHAVRLLTTLVVYCEETITVDAHVLIQTLLREWLAPEIARELRVVADLVGRFVAPETYMPLMLARIRGDADVSGSVIAPDATATALEVLHQLMLGSLDRTLLPHVHDVLDALAVTHILDVEHARAKLALGSVVQSIAQLLQRRGSEAVAAHFLQHGRLPTMQRVYDRLFDTALVVSRTERSADAVACAASTLDALVQLEGRESVAELIDAHFCESLARAAAALTATPAVQWTHASAPQLVLEELLRRVSVEILATAAPTLTQLAQHVLAAAETTGDDSTGESSGSTDARARASSSSSNRATQRAAALTTALQALFVRAERDESRTVCKPGESRAWCDALQELETLVQSSRAAAA